jgi:hypothetical protein
MDSNPRLYPLLLRKMKAKSVKLDLEIRIALKSVYFYTYPLYTHDWDRFKVTVTSVFQDWIVAFTFWDLNSVVVVSSASIGSIIFRIHSILMQ